MEGVKPSKPSTACDNPLCESDQEESVLKVINFQGQLNCELNANKITLDEFRRRLTILLEAYRLGWI